MKQIGLALHNYEDTYKSFPIGMQSGVSRPNWRVPILSFLDQAPLYKKLDLGQSFLGTALAASNTVLSNLSLAMYDCPSSILSDNPTDANNTAGTMVPDYVGIMGAWPDPAGRTTVGSASNYGGVYSSIGMLVGNEVKGLRDCVDGTSSTIIVAEQSATVGSADLRSRYYGGFTGISFSGPSAPRIDAVGVRTTDTTQTPSLIPTTPVGFTDCSLMARLGSLTRRWIS